MRALQEIPDAEATLQTIELFDAISHGDIRPFNNAQTFHPDNKRMYYTLTFMEPSGAPSAVIARSDGELLPYTAEAIQREGFYVLTSNINPNTHALIPPEVPSRWSRLSLKNFLFEDGWASTPAKLYETLANYLERFVYHDDPRVLHFLALFTMGSYVYITFESLPIVLITGERETGKTRMIEIISELAFNGRIRSSLTSAIMARQIQRDQPLLCIDESEDLARGRGHQEMFRLLRAMYRRSGSREVCGRDGTSALFQIFTPVVLVNIGGVDDALRDRMVELPSVRRRQPVEHFYRGQQVRALQQLRDELYGWGCAYATQVYETAITLWSTPDFSDRTQELWLPLFALATVIDNTAPAPFLLKEMVEFAKDRTREKAEQDHFEATESRIIAGVYYFLADHSLLGNAEAEVNAASLTEFIKTMEELPALRSEDVSHTLGQAKLIVRKFRRRTASHPHPLVHYVMDVDRLQHRAKALGVSPVTADVWTRKSSTEHVSGAPQKIDP